MVPPLIVPRSKAKISNRMVIAIFCLAGPLLLFTGVLVKIVVHRQTFLHNLKATDASPEMLSFISSSVDEFVGVWCEEKSRSMAEVKGGFSHKIVLSVKQTCAVEYSKGSPQSLDWPDGIYRQGGW